MQVAAHQYALQLMRILMHQLMHQRLSLSLLFSNTLMQSSLHLPHFPSMTADGKTVVQTLSIMHFCSTILCFSKVLGTDEHVSVVGLMSARFTCVSYAEARNRYRLDVRPSVRPSVRLSVRHTPALYQNG